MAGDWRDVDEGWGREAVDFATLSEPGNCREYVALHHRLSLAPGERLLDIACGAGLALELAGLRGATCAGLDASPRLVAVARDRSPGADIQVGDMHALPWTDGSFDVVTSFRGIWGTTPEALAEVHRVLRPGGRVGLTVWGHIKASPGAWALRPFTLAAEPKVRNQAAMVALGRPGAGEELLASHGFTDVDRVGIPFRWEFADPEHYARSLASTGPAFEAIQTVGADRFHELAVEVATGQLRAGLPLRAEILVVGYVARTPAAASAEPGPSYLPEPPPSPGLTALFDADVEEVGYVMNASRLWGHLPEAQKGLFEQIGAAARAAGLTVRQRGILVSACASAMGDSYCSLAWGSRLANEAGDEVAARVLDGDVDGLDPAEQALARWARQVATDPNATTAEDVQSLLDAGYDHSRVLALTHFVALRVAFSTVNDALGALPDRELGDSVPGPVRDAVTWGRPVAGMP